MRVFHLTRAEYALSNVALGRLKIARIAELNDPFELLAANLGNNKALRVAMREWRNEMHKTKGLLCFSGDWESTVLWSHYADKHRGICLGFELNDGLVQNVNYVSERIPVPLTADKRFAPDADFMRALLTTKYIHWQYEDEVRVFVNLDPKTIERGLFYYLFSSDLRLTEVILGSMCEIPIERVRNLVSKAYPDACVLKARPAFKSFHIVPRPTSLDRPYKSPRGTTTQPMPKT